jgi:hypothetical protein
MRKSLLFSLLLIFIILQCYAVQASTMLINSKDWKDVYSGMQYGFLTGTDPKFLVSEKHSTLILNDISQAEPVEIYSSRKNPWVFGYASTVKARGFEQSGEVVFDSLSIELAKRLPDIKNYIIIDDSYGYNAVAVAPYAIVSKSYVLFADRTNINEILSFLNSKTDLNHIIVYGNVDRNVRDGLAGFNPEVINKDGDRFANNVEIVKKYKLISDKTQVLMTNGEFIEADLMSGEYPTLFIGVDNVPDKIKEYIQNSNIQVGVLIGNELVGTATVVRRQTGISTFVKFARSARNPTGPVAQVEGLDIFRLPKYDLSIAITAARYNSVTHQMEFTMRNNVELATYYKATYTITSGAQSITVGDLDPIFIDGGDEKTLVYDIDPIVGTEDINVKAFVIYGESKDSLERAFEQVLVAERVTIYDDSSIAIKKITYQKDKKRFVLELENLVDKEVYAKTEVVDVMVLDERKTFGSADIVKIPPNGKKNSIIEAELVEEDFVNNENVRARAYYGLRENALAKIVEGQFELVISSMNLLIYLPIVVIVVLFILLILAAKKKKRKKQP